MENKKKWELNKYIKYQKKPKKNPKKTQKQKQNKKARIKIKQIR